MQFTSAEIVSWLGGYLWPLFRIAGMVMVAPVFSTQSVPARVRLMLAVAITALVAPLLPAEAPTDVFTWDAIVIIAQQILIGVAMGMALQLVFGAVIIGGAVIATQMGLGFASMVDPANGMQVPVLSQVFLMLTTLLFLIMDGHLVLIELVVESFEVIPIAPDGLTRESFWAIAAWGAKMFAAGLWLALPAVASLLVINISFGVMARAAPQLQIFAIGFPITTIMGYVILLLTLPNVVPQFTSIADSGFELIRTILSGGG